MFSELPGRARTFSITNEPELEQNIKLVSSSSSSLCKITAYRAEPYKSSARLDLALFQPWQFLFMKLNLENDGGHIFAH
ncbi:hypothetical protein OROMI_005743 [Orobanche minor]